MNARMALLLLSGALASGHLATNHARAADPTAPPGQPAPPAVFAPGKPCTVTPNTPATTGCAPSCGSPSCAPSCATSSCCASPCCSQNRGGGWAVEVDAAFLLWWVKSNPTPPLTTVSDAVDLGVLGAPTTGIALGNSGYSSNPVAGGRFAARVLANESLGIQVGGFLLENSSVHRSVTGNPVIALPFVDPAGGNAALVLQAPGSATGGVALSIGSHLWGLDASGLARARLSDALEIDLLAGFRFVQLSESLALGTTTTTAVPGFFDGTVTPAGSTYLGIDRFGTRNNFYGGQVGARAVATFGYVTAQATASVALGSTHQSVNVAGLTTLLAPGEAPAFAPGNLYTQQTNIGKTSRDTFGVIPQVGIALGVQVLDWARVTVGYDFLYWNDVARPGSQIDRTVNPSLPPILDDGTRLGPARPAPLLVGSDYWAQGLTFGLELAF